MIVAGNGFMVNVLFVILMMLRRVLNVNFQICARNDRAVIFKVLMNLRNPNYENGEQPSFRSHLGLIQVPLKVKDIPELVSIFFLTRGFCKNYFALLMNKILSYKEEY